MGRATAYDWRAADPEFAKRWEEAKALGAEALEDEAVRRAHEGWEEPVFHLGVATDTVRKYDSTLLIFLLKGAKPEKYRELSRMELTGANGGPVHLSDTDTAAKLAGIIAAAKARQVEDLL